MSEPAIGGFVTPIVAAADALATEIGPTGRITFAATIVAPGPPSNKRGGGSMKLGSGAEERADPPNKPTLANAAAEGAEKAAPPA
jgi:hypothetical protein